MTTNVKVETQIELKKFNEEQLLEILTRMRDAVERLQIGLIVNDHTKEDEDFKRKFIKHLKEGLALVESEYLSR